MKTLQRLGSLPKLDTNLSPGFIFIYKVLEWLMSFDSRSGLFDASREIYIRSHDHPFHHYISCLNGRPLWGEGQGLVADLLSSLEQPVIQFEAVETEKGMRFYVVIITKKRVSWHSELVNKALAFGTLENEAEFFVGEREFINPLRWENNLAYRQFLRFI